MKFVQTNNPPSLNSAGQYCADMMTSENNVIKPWLACSQSFSRLNCLKPRSYDFQKLKNHLEGIWTSATQICAHLYVVGYKIINIWKLMWWNFQLHISVEERLDYLDKLVLVKNTTALCLGSATSFPFPVFVYPSLGRRLMSLYSFFFFLGTSISHGGRRMISLTILWCIVTGWPDCYPY